MDCVVDVDSFRGCEIEDSNEHNIPGNMMKLPAKNKPSKWMPKLPNLLNWNEQKTKEHIKELRIEIGCPIKFKREANKKDSL